LSRVGRLRVKRDKAERTMRRGRKGKEKAPHHSTYKKRLRRRFGTIQLETALRGWGKWSEVQNQKHTHITTPHGIGRIGDIFRLK